jgi:hypothetical protein
MGAERTDERGPGNVIPFESLKRKRETCRRHACISMTEDATGEINYRIEGVTCLNALAFLHLMLYLSDRALKIHLG